MSKFTRERIIRICMILILVICGAAAFNLLTKPKLSKYTESVDEILISCGDHAADVTKEDSLKGIVEYLNESKLSDLPGNADITFDNNSINCQFKSKGKEIMYITITNNEEYPYVVKLNGKNYTISKVNTPFNSQVKKFIY